MPTCVDPLVSLEVGALGVSLPAPYNSMATSCRYLSIMQSCYARVIVVHYTAQAIIGNATLMLTILVQKE